MPNGVLSQNLLQQASEKFPYLRGKNIGYVDSTGDPAGGDRMLEFWPANEPGAALNPRPASLPIDQVGVQVFSPQTTPMDVLADYVSHHAVENDPRLRDMYQQFSASVPESVMRGRYQHHVDKFGESRPYQDWLGRTGMPEYFRGYTFNQWPNAAEMYSPAQIQQLDAIRSYLGIK